MEKSAKKEIRMLASTEQEWLWNLSQVKPKINSYNTGGSIFIDMKLNIKLLKKSLEMLFDKYDSLRSTFGYKNDKLYRVIDTDKKAVLEIVESTLDNTDEIKSNIDYISHKMAEKIFDLKHGPVIRVLLIQYPKNRFGLIYSMHQMIGINKPIDFFLKALFDTYQYLTTHTVVDMHEYSKYLNIDNKIQKKNTNTENDLNYWSERLSGSLERLDFYNITTKIHRTYKVDNVCCDISQDLYKAVQAASVKYNTNPSYIYLICWQLLLARYSNKKDVVVGSQFPEYHSAFLSKHHYLIRDLFHIIPCRLSIDDNISFEDILLSYLPKIKNDMSHLGVNFNDLIKKLNISINSDYYPLFQTGFIYEKPFPSQFQINDKSGEIIHLENGEAIFDLMLKVTHENHQDKLVILYKDNLFKNIFIQRMLNHFKQLLREVLKSPKQPVKSYQLLTEYETKKQLLDWTNTENIYSHDKTIHQLFEEQVAKTPNKIAVVFRDDQLTYDDLNKQANKLAHYLRSLGVKPDTLIALACDRSLEMIVSLLAIIKAGGAYVPIDLAYPADRILHMLDDTKASLILTQSHLSSKLPNTNARIINVDTLNDLLSDQPSTNPISNVTEKNLAYIIYTSGSTGKPKGVLIDHGNTIAHMYWMVTACDFNENDRVLQRTTLSFDASVWEWILPLTVVGCTLCIMEPNIQSDIFKLKKTIDFYKITTIQFVPILLDTFLKHSNKGDCPSLKKVMCGGGAILPELARLFFTLFPDSVLYNLYGPTEATIDTVYFEYNSKRIPSIPVIGKPISNTRTYILDNDKNILPIGCIGELYIASILLSRGYLHLPDLTAAKFIANPFATDKDKENKQYLTLYRTGDLCRYCEDGNIEYIGRIDNQVKIRGFRIELDEIEHAILNCHEIDEAVVMAKQDAAGNNQLIAYVILDKNHMRMFGDFTGLVHQGGLAINLKISYLTMTSISFYDHDHNFKLGNHLNIDIKLSNLYALKDVRLKIIAHKNETFYCSIYLTDDQKILLQNYISELKLIDKSVDELFNRQSPHSIYKELHHFLPDYMIPAKIIALDQFPLLPNGKIDRKNLPDPLCQNKINYIKPRNDIEERIAKIWMEVLAINSIGVHDNFFDLGGHSLLLVTMIRKVSKELKNEIHTRDFLKNPTIEHLSMLADNTAHVLHSGSTYLDDISLADDLPNPCMTKASTTHPKSILLTGVTGFLGGYLLDELLKTTTATIYCLIRPQKQQNEREYLIACLNKFNLSLGERGNRVVIVKGDFSEENLGLSDNDYQMLVNTIDIIYHNGALVNHLYDYTQLRMSNVISTLKLLAMAGKKKNKHFVFVSTRSASFDKNEQGIPLDVFPQIQPKGNEGGYAISKWVAEKILEVAHKKGYITTIYRPNYIMGDTNQGVSPLDNTHIWMLIKGMIQMGYAPQHFGTLDMCPVDFVAKIIVQSSLMTNNSSNIYNFYNAQQTSFDTLYKWLIKQGYRLSLISRDKWQSKICSLTPENALFPLVGLYLENDEISEPHIETGLTQATNLYSVLQHLKTDFPSLNEELFKKYIMYAKQWLNK